MKYGCPNENCNSHKKTKTIINYGTYFRKNDSRKIQRYKCTNCNLRFSGATFSLAKNQKKRRVNRLIFELLASGVSGRRIAKIARVNRITVARKLVYLGKKSKNENTKLLKKLESHKAESMQFDDLITSEHTKLKPLTVTVAVDSKRRFILGAEVSQIPAFGTNASLSVKKYGYRKSNQRKGLDKLLFEIKNSISNQALIETDEHNLYPQYIKKHFSSCEHKTYKSARGCVAGQGEMKKLKYDPLFQINHACAMLRANINRLIRRTWCTTKDPQMLEYHIQVFINYFNSEILLRRKGQPNIV